MTNIVPDPKSVQTGLRVPEDVLRRIDAIARQRGRTRSRIIVELLRAALDMPEPLPRIARPVDVASVEIPARPIVGLPKRGIV